MKEQTENIPSLNFTKRFLSFMSWFKLCLKYVKAVKTAIILLNLLILSIHFRESFLNYNFYDKSYIGAKLLLKIFWISKINKFSDLTRVLNYSVFLKKLKNTIKFVLYVSSLNLLSYLIRFSTRRYRRPVPSPPDSLLQRTVSDQQASVSILTSYLVSCVKCNPKTGSLIIK